MENQNPKKIGGLLAATLLFASMPSAFCGDTTALSNDDSKSDDKTVIEKKPDANPFSFYDGKVVVDMQERLRVETQNNTYDFNGAKNAVTDGSFLQQRFRIGLLIHPVSWLKFYIQGEDAVEAGERPKIPGASGAEGDDYFNLRQAYVEISDYDKSPLGLKIGRQVLSYGDERLVGEFDWNNFSRTFDAAKLTLKGKGFSVDTFVSSPVTIWGDKIDESDITNQHGKDPNRDLFLSGAYLTVDPLPFGTWDFYAFMLDQANGNTSNQQGTLTTTLPKGSLTARSDFATLGTRIKGDPAKLHGWEYSGEFAYQVGTVRGLDLNAFAGNAGIGYNWLETPWAPRLFAEYNYASGDNNPNDKTSDHTFQNLFPTNHPLFGIMDLFSWQNMEDVRISARVSPVKSVTLETTFGLHWLATTNDAWYRANGLVAVRPLNAAARSASSYVGAEVDLIATWNATKNLQFQAGYSHFFAGSYLEDTGADSDADFGYVQAKITF